MIKTALTSAADRVTAIIGTRTGVSDARRVSLTIVADLGADDATLICLIDAIRLARAATIVLPSHHYEGLSRGRGWARKGRGDSATWGERVDGGYLVGLGHWTVGASDGFSRKDSTGWTVEHVTVGSATWTIAK